MPEHFWYMVRVEAREQREKRCISGILYFRYLNHRAQRSQIRLQIRPIFTVQIDPVGTKLPDECDLVY